MTVEDKVHDELIGLCQAVSGIDGCVVATSDGLLVTHVLPGEEQSQVAALISTLIALARHAVGLTGRGGLQDAAIRGSSGYLVVYAVGDNAVLAVMGRADLNVALLQLRTRPVVERLTALAGGFARFVSGPEDFLVADELPGQRAADAEDGAHEPWPEPVPGHRASA